MTDSLPLEVPVQLERGNKTTALIYSAQSGQRSDGGHVRKAALILAHGAGAGQRHQFMVGFARGLAERGLDVVTFNFLYTEQRRRVPDRMPQLIACYEVVIAATREHLASAREHLFIGGKSMGGRVATHVAAETPIVSGFPGPSVIEGSRTVTVPVAGIVLLGYPLHPPGRPDRLRDAHLSKVGRPMLFVQGSRDAFGTSSELKPIFDQISPAPTLHTVDGGDHSFKITGRDSRKQAAVYGEIQDRVVTWIASTP